MVPPHHSLHRNTPVLIVLKADQPTGKLTSGLIADILTRGNHPRGVKVRLQDGRIGRVQALRSSSESLTRAPLPTEEVRAYGEKGKRKGGVSGGCHDRDEGAAVQSTTSLGDYMKPAKSRVREAASSPTITTTQEQLERAFPGLDSALIAAILADYPAVHDAEGVLEALCVGIVLNAIATNFTGIARAVFQDPYTVVRTRPSGPLWDEEDEEETPIEGHPGTPAST